jgi:hypothetical protein
LHDVIAQRAHWREFGPPSHIGIAVLAQVWGAKLTEEPKSDPAKQPKPINLDEMMLTTDMTAIQPIAGGDTFAASMAILEKLKAGNG